MTRRIITFAWLSLLGWLTPLALGAAPVQFDVPAQPADTALLAFSRQAKVEVFFSFDELRKARSVALVGRFEPEEALNRMLKGTGFVARRNGNGKFVVARIAPSTASIRGHLETPEGRAVADARVLIPDARLAATTDAAGAFFFSAVPAGTYRLIATAPGFQTLTTDATPVEPDTLLSLKPMRLMRADEPAQLAAVVVEGTATRIRPFERSETPFVVRTATGNLDRPRTENDALPYLIYDRDQIQRSGVVNLNEFLQRELIDSDPTRQSPEQDASRPGYVAGSGLSLRGYGFDETVVLVNGRRLPEVLSHLTGDAWDGRPPPPDVNFIPLSLVQQVEVLPVSASALYSGNAVGGVINIVLRPGVDATATELATTYTNALRSFDAPQSSISLLHAQSLLNGALRVRLNASLTRSTPATESELGYLRAHARPPTWAGESVFRATPNIRSANLTPLARLGPSPVTSVAPGADGTGGLAAFAGRSGVANLDFFPSPGGLTASHNSTGYPYGREQQREVYFGSVTYDVLPNLQFGVDATHARTTVHRGYEVVSGDFVVQSGSPLNPFGQEVFISLNEFAPHLGEKYSEARLQFSSVVLGAMLTLPADWHVLLDAQYAHNLTKYRGLAGADTWRWQQLIDEGRYNPFRDTLAHPASPEFYDEVLVYRGGHNRFVTLGSYDTLDLAFRGSNEALKLPTGTGAVTIGGDYRRNHLDDFLEEPRYGDGRPAGSPAVWDGRTLTRYSIFGEVRAPLLPTHRLPRWLRQAEANLAVRYVAADTALEANVAPTYGLKLDFAGGVMLRGSFTTSSRYPTPHMSRAKLVFSDMPGAGVEPEYVFDPRRQQRYEIQNYEALDPELLPEGAVTQTAGVVFRRGRTHRFRAALDFVDTHKTNEITSLNAQTVMNLESLVPERVDRADPGPDETAGRVRSVLTGATNLASRHSQNFNLSFDYAGSQFPGGTFEAYARLLYFHRYEVKGLGRLPNTSDELRHPEGVVPGLLKYRSRFGAGWSGRHYGFGVDGHYFHSRILPAAEWTAQNSDRIKPSWQFDAYVRADLGAWLPWHDARGLQVQLRVNNVVNFDFPKYVNHRSGAGVQPYGDWRGRVYSLTLTATF